MASIVECIDIINENLLFALTNEIKTNFPNKETNERLREKFENILKEKLECIKKDVDQFHVKNGLYEKIEALQTIIKNSEPSTETVPWRFFDDTNRSVACLTIENKRRLIERLVEIDGKYESINKSLENEVVESYKELVSLLNKLVEKKSNA